MFIYPLQNNFKHFFRVPEKFFNFLERKNMAKIVDNHTRRRWKVSVARELGSLSEALLYYQVLHHHVHMGEFSKSNEEFSKEVNQSPRTFRRKIKSLIDKGIVSIESGYNNIPIYKSVKKFDNSEESYKTYDLNHCLISKDNNAGVLLGHFIHKYTYWNEKEFFKTDKELMEELYMTSKELKRAKSILVKNKYISVRIGHARRCYYTVNMDHIENSINNLTSPAKTHRSALPKGTAQPYQNTPLSPAKTHRADKIDEPCQKGPRSPIKRDHQALPKGTTKPCQKGPYTVPVLKQELNNTCLFVCSSTTAREEIQPESSECEAIDLKTNKQENKIMKGEQPMSIEDPFPPKTQERPIEPFTMIGKWNDLIAPNNKILSLSVDRECELMKVLSEHFQGSVSKWDAYLQKVSDSSFLMGKIDPNFKINLGFILNPEKIRKILMGDYDDHVKGKAEYGHADNSEATSLVVTKGEYVKKILDSNDPAIIKKAKVTS